MLLDVVTGDVRTVGVGTAYVCTSNHDPEVCTSGIPLTLTDVACVRLSGLAEDFFSFSSWEGAGVPYTSDVKVGHITNLPYGPK